MEKSTVNRDEYSNLKGERYEMKKPVDSEILKGDGSFTGETHMRTEYTPKKGERSELRHHEPSDIWKV